MYIISGGSREALPPPPPLAQACEHCEHCDLVNICEHKNNVIKMDAFHTYIALKYVQVLNMSGKALI